MVALASFFVAGALAWLHLTLWGKMTFTGLNVFSLWALATVLGCAVDCYKNGTRQYLWLAGILLVSWAMSQIAWKVTGDAKDLMRAYPVMTTAIKNGIVCSAILVVSQTRGAVLAVWAHACVVLAAFLASRGVLSNGAGRPDVIIWFSYPDIGAVLQHAAAIIIGLAAGHGHTWMDGSHRRGAVGFMARPESMARTPRP